MMKYKNNTRSALNNILRLSLTSLLLIASTSGSASATHGTTSANHVVSARYVNAIQTKQAKSIEAGVRIGRLTPKEARKLRKEQHEITGVEREMRKDGTLNASELGKLFKKLQHSQNHINKLLRNNISTHAVETAHSDN